MAERRKDSKKRVLKEGEYQRSNGTYEYRWRSENGKRNNVYAKSLEELREKEAEIQRDRSDGIRSEARNATINDIHEQWLQLKKGLKANTLVNYEYMYKMYVFPEFGKRKVGSLKKSDVRRFYNGLVDSQRLKVATVENIHTVMHQVLDFAVEDEYLRTNPSDNALKELKQTHNLDSERCKALTAGQQKLLMNFLKNSEKYNHWLPIITVMVECGLRAGEATGLRWEDINLDTGEISVNHTLIYYSHREKGCLYGINTPKTEAGNRIVPMTPAVKAAFVQEREYQKKTGISCKVTIDGYTDFIFVNRFGECQHHSTINKGIDRIIRDCNEEQLAKCESGTIKPKNLVLLPKFSCHSLRHTCATRLCEAGINMKVIQDVLGHADITTTMNIYTEATKNLKKKEIDKFAEFLSATTTFDGKEEND